MRKYAAAVVSAAAILAVSACARSDEANTAAANEVTLTNDEFGTENLTATDGFASANSIDGNAIDGNAVAPLSDDAAVNAAATNAF